MNIICKILLALAAGLVISATAKAEGLTVGLHTLSYHAPERGQVNQNWGFYARTADQWEVGAYRNSYGRDGAYAAKGFDLLKGQYGTLGAQVGVVYGYQKKCTDTIVQTGSYKTIKYHHGETTTTTWPVYESVHQCTGFSRGAITPMAGIAYTAPFSIMSMTPRIQLIPGFKDHSSVIHLTMETAWK